MSPPPDDDADLATLRALQGRIRRPGVSLLYSIGMALVACGMVLLPLLYLAVIACAAYAVYWHATRHVIWLMFVALSPIFLIFVLCYMALLGAGLITLFFLLKPIFARRPRRAQPLALHPDAEPRLYAFIEAVCAAVGAPKPRRIDLNCELNASAGFRRGYCSFLGDDLVLTLGLPLVANLTVDELAGVVAHEFGHFNQGSAMRLGYLIGSINGWFARIVHERDAWDHKLEWMSDHPRNFRVALMVWVAQIGISASRLVLRSLMAVGVALSGFLSRQTEFDADACEIQLVGSSGFERACRKLATLQIALQHTQSLLRTHWGPKHQLPDDLPELLRRVHEDLPEGLVQQIHDTLGLSRTRWFDTHPCPAERIQRARLAARPGLLVDARPARCLFTRFDVPARQVTELHYRDDLGIDLPPQALVPLPPRDDASAAGSVANQAGSYRDLAPRPIRHSLLLDAAELLLPLPLGPLRLGHSASESQAGVEDLPEATGSPEAWRDELAALVEQLPSVRPQLAELVDRARAVGPCPVRFDDNPVPTPPVNPARDAPEDLADLRHAAREIARSTTRRLQLGLLLRVPTLDSEEAARLQEFHDWLQSAQTEYDTWRGLAQRVPLTIAELSKASVHHEYPEALKAQVEEIQRLRSALLTRPRVTQRDKAEARKLRIGPHGELIRELEELAREATDWFTTYRFALQGLWEIAGREERTFES